MGIEALVDKGLVEMEAPRAPANCEFTLTAGATTPSTGSRRARRTGLTELLEGWDPEAHPEIGLMVRHLAHELLADDEKLLADAKGSVSHPVGA